MSYNHDILVLMDQIEQMKHKIYFDEAAHAYFFTDPAAGFDAVRNKKSVTTLISKFFPAFNQAHVARMSAASKSRITGKTVTADDIVKAWNKTRDSGTNLHAHIENTMNFMKENNVMNVRDPHVPKPLVTSEDKSYNAFIHFYENYVMRNGWNIVASEMMVFDASNKIAGSVDAVFCDHKTGEVIICDWKRSVADLKKIESGSGKCMYPLENMVPSKKNRYTLQLNIYRYFVRKLFGFTGPIRLVLVFLNENNEYPLVIENIDNIADDVIAKMIDYDNSYSFLSSSDGAGLSHDITNQIDLNEKRKQFSGGAPPFF